MSEILTHFKTLMFTEYCMWFHKKEQYYDWTQKIKSVLTQIYLSPTLKSISN